jgi:N6-L-threonylcarbamoyladenine synthase
MIAFAGALRLAAGERGPEAPAVRIRPRWPMVDLRPPAQAPAAL